jgi:hypothetical protein
MSIGGGGSSGLHAAAAAAAGTHNSFKIVIVLTMLHTAMNNSADRHSMLYSIVHTRVHLQRMYSCC